MRNYLLFSLAVCLLIGKYCYASDNSSDTSGTVGIENIHKVLESNTWFYISLQNNVLPEFGMQNFTATMNYAIYNKDFSEVLIPDNAIVYGTYQNDAVSCRFNINKIIFKGTEISFKSKDYSTVSTIFPGKLACNPKMKYLSPQLLEFKTNVAINNLAPVDYNRVYIPLNTQDNFVQAFGSSDYSIRSITKFTNKLMKVVIEYKDQAIVSKIIPVFYDNYGQAHQLNFTTEEVKINNLKTNQIVYIFTSAYDKFGFGTLYLTRSFF